MSSLNDIYDATKNLVVLRCVNSKTGYIVKVQPCKDRQTGQYPPCVKKVNSQGDMIMTDAERNSGKLFIPEDAVFDITDGTAFDLNNEYENATWQAIKNSIFIVPTRDARDKNGNLIIDGDSKRYGIAEFYVENPGEEARKRVSKREKRNNAYTFIFNDEKGREGRLLKTKLLGHSMVGKSDADVQDYLLNIADGDPDKIIEIYTGDDMKLRLLFMEAKEKNVIYIKNKLWMYADNVVLGATDTAVITWMKQSSNNKMLQLIQKDTFPEYYEKLNEEAANTILNNTTDSLTQPQNKPSKPKTAVIPK